MDTAVRTAFACLALAARLHGCVADPDALLHALAPRAGDPPERLLLAAARALGLRARCQRCDPARLETLPLPALARERDGTWCVLAACAQGRVLVQRAGEAAAIASLADFARRWDGTAILLQRATAPAATGTRRGWRLLLPHARRHAGALGEVLAASVVLQVLALLGPVAFQVVIDKVLAHRALATLDLLVTGLLAAAIAEGVLGGLRAWLLAHTGARIDVAFAATVARHLLRLPLAWFRARRAGEITTRLRELDVLRQFLTGGAVALLVESPFALLLLAGMALYSPALAAVVVAAIAAQGLLAAAFAPALRTALAARAEHGADGQARLTEAVGAIETLKAAALEARFARDLGDALAAQAVAGRRAATLGAIATQAVAAAGRVGQLALLWLGARYVLAGALSVGELIACNMLAARCTGPVLRLAQLWQEWQHVALALRRLDDVLGAAPEPEPRAGAAPLARVAGGIRIEGASCRYRPDGPEVLGAVTLEIRPGETVGLVGPSGSGKSTLARLLAGLCPPTAGRVCIDGVDVALFDPARLRRQVALVPQEARLLAASVRDNIAGSDGALPEARLLQVAQLTGAHAVALALPAGYATLLGEQGATLSGGERQRLALARALAAAPAILILDEATAALDAAAERRLHDALAAGARGRTTLVIAHRPGALRHAQRIVVLEGGRITDVGTPAELLARGGWYARMIAEEAGATGPPSAAPAAAAVRRA